MSTGAVASSAASARAADQRRMDGLQAGRAIAALAVSAFHCSVYVLPERLLDGQTGPLAFRAGYSGVEFFFVLSGFIMLQVHRRDIRRPGGLSRFLRRRLVRIFPIYWLVLAGLAVLAAVAGLGPAGMRNPAALAGSALLLPWPRTPALEVAWTLRHEMLFYAIFAVMLLRPGVGVAVFVLWFAAALVTTLTGLPDDALAYTIAPYNLLFGIGMLAAAEYGGLSPATARRMIGTGLLVFLFVGQAEAQGLIAWPLGLRTLLYGIGGGLTVAGIAASRPPVPAALVAMGNASYVLYLIHVPVMAIAARLLAKAGTTTLPAIVYLVALVALAAAVAQLIHALVEQPLLRRLSAWPLPVTTQAAP